MFMSRTFLAAAIVSMVFLMACGSGPSRDLETYYLVAHNTQDPYFQDAQAGLESAGAALGVNVEMVGPEGNEPGAQKSELDRVFAQTPAPSGIMVSVSDAEVLTPSINSAIARGINVITIGSDAPDSNRLSFVGTANMDLGEKAAEAVASQLGSSGGIAVLTTLEQEDLQQRLAGFTGNLDRLGDFDIIERVDIQGNAETAHSAAQSLVTGRNRTRINAIVCLEEIACPEVADVLTSNGVEDKVVIAMGTDQRTLDGIRQGVIDVTVAQRPYAMAYAGLRLLGDLYHYPPRQMEAEGSLSTVPQMVDAGAVLVNAQNLDAFNREREQARAAAAAPAE